MKILYYMPMKPPDHPTPSGDRVMGRELMEFLESRGHSLALASRLRARQIYWKPWGWPRVASELARIHRRFKEHKPDLWLTYHSYYKAPDVLGPAASRMLGIPYAIFQGVYSTKVRRRIQSLPGYHLNKQALAAADAVFTNKERDHRNLARLIAPERLYPVRPGLHAGNFAHDPAARDRLQRIWKAGDRVVVLTAAMLRPGVKADGVETVIRACGVLQKAGLNPMLAVAGDGSERGRLEALAQKLLPKQSLFLGKIPRENMVDVYSAADVFAFPGINEGLGMVYLEAQAAGLPVVAMAGWGAAEAVKPHVTGLLSAPYDFSGFVKNLARLVMDRPLREKMGRAGPGRIRKNHDLAANYLQVERVLQGIIRN